MGRDTALIRIAIMQRGEKHVMREPSPIVVADASTGAELRVGLVRGTDDRIARHVARLLPRPRPC